MTNAEKYQEVFGFPPDKGNCPAERCEICPSNDGCHFKCLHCNWWDEDYKGGADMRKPNCVRCDHFGKCEGCEKGEEE